MCKNFFTFIRNILQASLEYFSISIKIVKILEIARKGERKQSVNKMMDDKDV